MLGLAVGTLLLGCARAVPAGSDVGADCLVYVGTNVASEQDNTIYLYRLSLATGALTKLAAQPGGAAPTYLTMDASRRHLYAVSETQTFRGAAGGGVSAFAVDRQTGRLTLLNQQASGGASPCYVSLDRTAKHTPMANYALVANYVGGSVSVLPVQADGSLAPVVSLDQHQGRGPHKSQDGPHAHCFLTDLSNRYALAVDLGTDKVYAYRLDPAARTMQNVGVAFSAAPGAGPRHLTFHPQGRYAYLINELNSTITALDYDPEHGRFREVQTQSMLPAGFSGANSGADVHVSSDGRFVYGSNRGHNSLAVFAVNQANGKLTLVQHVSTQGQTPRNFALDPSGRMLLVANQNSNNIFIYRIDKASGKLTPTGLSAELPSPMFLQVVEDFTR